jgi:hypothetical protein
LIESDRPGHQYLTDEDVDDALVEVFLHERSRDPADGTG